MAAPPPVYYPSLVVNLTLRFDEAFHVFDEPAISTAMLATQIVGPIDISQNLTPEPLLTQPGVGVPIFGDAITAQQRNMNTLLNRIPKSASIEMPGFRQASKFNLTFDYRDIPVDPRLLRSIAVSIYMGAVLPENFSDGMVRYNDQGGRASVLQPSESNLLMTGLVDTWSASHTDKGSEIQMEGRDHRGWLLDTIIDPALEKGLDLNRPIDDVVLQILRKHPQGKNINVVTYVEDWLGDDAQGPLDLPSPGDPGKLTRSRLGANGKKPKANPPGSSTSCSYWLLITQYCQLVGACPVFVRSDLVIRPFKSLWDQQHGGLTPELNTPFSGDSPRNVTTGEASQETTNPIRIREFVYGRDIQSLTYERKYSTYGTPSTVLCMSVDPGKGRGNAKLVSAQWPTVVAQAEKAFALGLINKTELARVKADFAKSNASKKGTVAPSGKAVSENVLRIPVPGVKDASRLQEIAQAIFEEVKRGEMGGVVQTKNLSSFGGSNADPDLMRLRPGDAVQILVDQRALSSKSPLVNIYSDLARMPIAEAAKELRKRVGLGQTMSEDIARVIVATARGSIVELQTFFRVKNVKYNWAAGNGINIAFDFQNYIEARSKTAPPTTGGRRTKRKKKS